MFSPFSRPRGRLAALAGAACAAVLLPAAALAASPGHAATARQPVVVPKCGAAMPALRGGAFVWSANPGDGFAGGVSYELEVTNTGRHPCAVRGVPALAAVASNGHLVGSKVPASAAGPRIVLRPFATAHVNLIVHDAGAVCGHPVTARAVVYLPGQRRGQDASLGPFPACPGKPGGGVLSAGPIMTGAGIPFYTN